MAFTEKLLTSQPAAPDLDGYLADAMASGYTR
jgi:hypothetical protein